MSKTTITLRRYGDRFSTTSSYGVTAYGTTPYGGSSYPDETIGGLLHKSDNPADRYRSVKPAIVHRRGGIPVAVRVDSITGNVWNVQFLVQASEVESLKVYHQDRVLYILPDGPESDTTVLVLWSGDGYDAEPHDSPGYYTINATFEEIA